MPTRLSGLTAFFVFCSTASAFNIVLDPGHGGIDFGAKRGSFVESNIVLQIAKKVQSQLADRPNVNVFFTRSDSNGLSLKERVQIANDNQADLFLSLHANSSPASSVSGMEYYFNAQKNAPVFLKSKNTVSSGETTAAVVQSIQNDLVEFGKTKQSLDLSKRIQTAWMGNEFGKNQMRTSKIRRAPFYVIENTTMPSVLVEVGFISNQREARKLVTAEYQNELARALTEAVLEFKENSDK